MKRKSYGRDAGLSFRMLFTGALLGALYVGFAVVLFQVLNVGLIPMLLIVIGLAVFQYFTSDKLALAASGAKVVSEQEAPELHTMIERLCAMADLPKPRVAVIDTDIPNAFATGRSPKHAAVAVTTGLWRRLEPHEVEGVLAHELSHIANRDVLIMTLASFFAMLAGLLTRFGLYGGMFGGGRRDDSGGVPIWLIVFLVSLLTYFISYLLIRAISRYREYAADRGSALITGAPENLMSALQKIASGIMQIPQQDLRQVETMNAFFIVPDEREVHGRGAVRDPPAPREAARPSGRDRARDGQAGRVIGFHRRPLRTEEAQGRQERAPVRDLDRAHHARGRARAEVGRRRRALLQAAVGR